MNGEARPCELELDARGVIDYALLFHDGGVKITRNYHGRAPDRRLLQALRDADADELTQIAQVITTAINTYRPQRMDMVQARKRLLFWALVIPTGMAVRYTYETTETETTRGWKLYYFEIDGQEDPCWVREKDYDRFVRNREWSPSPAYWSESDIPKSWNSTISGVEILSHNSRQKSMEKRHPGMSRINDGHREAMRDWFSMY